VIEEGMVARLTADAGVQAIAGGNIFAGLIPDDSQANYPGISYSFVGGDLLRNFDTFGTRHQRVELNAHAFDKATASRLREAIIVCLQDWKDVLPDGITVIDCYLANPGIDFSGEDRIFRALVEFYVDFNPPK
jgi:hypothetical protein